ncbi:MAG TPA: ImmA/IrrE family metallo-endopeptidase [Pyrinomonadaceae bacterium]|nr:ImmA/IrrE family metallo-endopeptidase [Pyrinomonadaceae bacterium]
MKDIPPTQKGRRFEARGQALREFAGLRSDDERLDPFELARYAKLFVVPFEAIDSLSEKAREHLLGAGKDMWSGGAASVKLPSGEKLIILNPSHGRNRHAATLMEEVSHVFLGHKPSRLAVENTNSSGKTIARDYNHDIEEEAYGTGAAALIPYSSLKRMVSEGKTAQQIARHYGVSRALVEFRIKISRLWDDYAAKVFSG